MKIVRSEQMGLCYGVGAAIRKCHDIMNSFGETDVYILGELVHNEHVVNKMREMGFLDLTEEEVLSDPDKLKNGSTVVVRAHGTTSDVYEALKKKNVRIVDATCMFVSEIRDTLIEAQKTGRRIIFIGDKNHPEVKGIVSFGDNILIYKDLAELQEEMNSCSIDVNAPTAVLTQTTLNKKSFEDIKKYLKEHMTDIVIYDKICGATQMRQKAAEKLAGQVDAVIVIGGKNSSNTRKLYDIAKSINDNTHIIQDENDLEDSWFQDIQTIGITAGASTPDEIIIKVETKLRGQYNAE